MRTLTTLLGVLAALVLLGVSGAMNYLFLSSLGKSPPEAHVLGAASAAADMLKALLPFFIAWAWRAGRYAVALPGLLVWVFFAGFSFLSAVGFAADNRGVFSHSRENLNTSYESALAALKAAEAKLRAIPQHRPAGVVTEEIERQKQDWRWGSTKACTDATLPASRTFCERYFTLRAERAAGLEAQKIEGRIAALKTKTERLRASGAGEDADPQVSLLSRLSGHEQDRVRLALIIIVALLVEIGSSLGLFLATNHGAKLKRRETPDADDYAPKKARRGKAASPTVAAQTPPQRKSKRVGPVEDFCLECLLPAPDGRLTLAELFEAYQKWCGEKRMESLTKQAFTGVFKTLVERLELRKKADRYEGIGIAKYAAGE